MKQVIVLVGPKGAGKSTIGHLLAAELDVHFIRVEPLFLELRAQIGATHPDFEERGFRAVLECLHEALVRYDALCFETTGASVHVPWLLSALERIARVLPVRVLATPAQCVTRVHSRDESIHIPVSDDQVERINAMAVGVELPWAAVIDNRGPFSPGSIVPAIRALLLSAEHGGA